ncbi:MAG: glycosyltransferase [Planctomycetota bacterium]
MRILCNLPLESFDDRANLRGVELCTYGPEDRMLVEGVHYPFDVAFDPQRGSIHELLAALPNGFRPDLVLLFWPDQEPLPRDLHRCPVPVVGVVSDYNLTLPMTTRLQPFFDVLLCDRAGVPLFERLGHPDVRYFCQYTWKRPFHGTAPDAPRDLDVAFAGNLNPAVQRERGPWIDRLRALARDGHRVEVHQGLIGADYGRLLGRARIGFNRSIRGEMNLRAFEVPACGALLLMERANLEVREFFVPDEECALYGDDDFEDVVTGLLRDEPRRRRIAAAGWRRVQEHSLGNRMPALLELLARPGPGRPAADDGAAALGRAEAMLTTWASGEAQVAAAMDAVKLLPDDARALNALALATLRWRGAAGADAAFKLLQRAATVDPTFAPPCLSLAELLADSDLHDLRARCRAAALQRVRAARDWRALSGPLLPFGFAARAVDWSHALQRCVRTGRPDLAIDAAIEALTPPVPVADGRTGDVRTSAP